MAPSGRKYKIKLASGRILGPLDLERIQALISKNQITGEEVAREYPKGEWLDINQIPEIAELLIARAGQSPVQLSTSSHSNGNYRPILGTHVNPLGTTRVLDDSNAQGPALTEVLPSMGAELGTLPELPEDGAEQPPVQEVAPEPAPAAPVEAAPAPEAQASANEFAEEEKTQVGDFEEEEKTKVESHSGEIGNIGFASRLVKMLPGLRLPGSDIEGEGYSGAEPQRNISTERTIIFERSADSPALPGKRRLSRKELVRATAIAVALAFAAGDLLFPEAENKPKVIRWEPVRPKMPAYLQGKSNPEESVKLYREAMKLYVGDNVLAYKAAADKLQRAASLDVNNVRALAMLASCYLNLIDSSNKDENYFSVISKLIELSRSKTVDLPESVIADVEFYLTINKAEAAQNRIVEYTKLHQNFAPEMYFYLAQAFFARADYSSAARYLSGIPDNQIFSAKIFYLRGQIAEKLGQQQEALLAYDKAIQMNPKHAKSRLRIASILGRQGQLKQVAKHLDFLVNNGVLLAPRDLGEAYYLHSQLNLIRDDLPIALGDIERAVKLEKDNPDYLLELYALRARSGDNIASFKKDARMYYYLGEGEKFRKQGNYQEALVQFIQARQSNLGSPLPLVKMGDMFVSLNDMGNARENYRLAAERVPNDIDIWSKYIDVLIQSYDWEEAEKAMNRFRSLPVSQSAIDKAAGDMYARQNRHVEAQMMYKKAMARDSIDPDVYIAYARSLMATRNFKDAPFFFALAQRFDPLSVDAIVGIAKCVAATEGTDRAIVMLQDELQKSNAPQAELLSAIAEFQIQRGEWELAQQYVDQAMQANPTYAYPWKLQAKIHMNRDGLEKDALDRALAAYKSYSERNLSDPVGYLERYRVFVRKAEFEAAKEELMRIYELYPKYPDLHYFQGALYSAMGNHRAAIEEFARELKNNPNSVSTMVALGKELIEAGDVNSALTHFNKAMQLAPQASEPKHWSGYANYLLKNYHGAVALFNAALMFDKGNPLIYKRLGMAYRDMGDGAGARANFKKYLEMDPDAADKAEYEKYL